MKGLLTDFSTPFGRSKISHPDVAFSILNFFMEFRAYFGTLVV